jgi:transcriptional regulator with XRE-family HTH domain
MEKQELLKYLGANIKRTREEKGMTQQELASLCNFEKSNMSRLEAGNTNPTIYTLYKVALALKVDLTDVIIIADA